MNSKDLNTMSRIAGIFLLLSLVACGDNSVPVEQAAEPVDYNAALEGSIWELEQITVMGGFVFEPETVSDYSIRFRPEQRLTGKSDCNTFTATWQAEENLTISNFSSTRSMCIVGSLHNYFSLYLRDVVSMDLAADSLRLGTTTEGVSLQFRPAP